jgi:hypothetical protein
MRSEEDPGWKPALKAAGSAFIPFAGLKLAQRSGRGEGLLVVDRKILIALATAQLLFVIAFSFICPWDGGEEGMAPWIVVGVGLICLVTDVWLMRRRWTIPSEVSPKGLAGAYRTRMFIGIAIAELPALLSIVTTFVIQNSLWLIVLGAAFTLAGLWIVAPSSTNIARDQGRLREQGSTLDLTRALNTVPRPGSPDAPE